MANTVEDLVKNAGKPKTFFGKIKYGAVCVKDKVMEGVEWIADHPREAAILGTAATGIMAFLNKGLRSADRYFTAKRETYNKDRYVYDHSSGRYVKTNRALSQSDILRITTLRAANPGMTMTEALYRLGLFD